MKLFGHPVHPLFIHFPTALLPMDFVLSFLGFTNGNPTFAQAGFYCLAGGVLTGFAAIVTGLFDLTNIPKANKIALGSGLLHGFINGCLILVFAVIAYKEWQIYPQSVTATKTMLVIKGILVAALFFGNYLGGRLIYQHFIGIDIKPKDHGNVERKSRPVNG